jgi:hypothetical protein
MNIAVLTRSVTPILRCSVVHGRLPKLGEKYTLEYLPLFDEELAAAVM